MAHRVARVPFVALLAILGPVVLAPLGAHARSDGSITGVTTSGGCNCHGGVDANGDVTATITAMDGDNTILASATETYMLAISLAGGDLVGTGIDVAVSDDDAGSNAFLGESSATMQIVSNEITQMPSPATNGIFTYLFTVTAPLAMGFGSTVTLTAVGLEFNDGQGSNGDSWDFATPFAFTVIPEPTTGLLFGLGLFGLTVIGRKRA